MLRKLLLSVTTAGMLTAFGPAAIAGDDGDPRDYRRDVERKLRNLERREYERQRDHAERLWDDDDLSPREYYRSQQRLERERREDLRDYEEWRRERDEDFERSQRRRYDRFYDDDVTRPYSGRYYYYDGHPAYEGRYETGYRGHRDGFRVNVGRFSFYID